MKSAISTVQNDSVLSAILCVRDALFPIIKAPELTIMALVCKEFRCAILPKYRPNILKKDEICNRIISHNQYNYLVNYDCPINSLSMINHGRFDLYDKLGLEYCAEYTQAAVIFERYDKLRLKEYQNLINTNFTIAQSSDLLAYTIRAGQFGMMLHLLMNGFIIYRWHTAIALKHSIKIFDYLLGQSFIFDISDIDAKEIIDTYNQTAIDAINARGYSLFDFMDHAIDSHNYRMIHHLESLQSRAIRNRAVIKDNLAVFQYLYAIKKSIFADDIRAAVLNESVEIVKFIMQLIPISSRATFFNLALDIDSVKIFKLLIPSHCPFSSIVFRYALYKRAKKVLKCIGYDNSIFIDIINTHDAEILELFPEIIKENTLSAFIRANNEVGVKWLIGKGIEFTLMHYNCAYTMSYTNLMALYKQ